MPCGRPVPGLIARASRGEDAAPTDAAPTGHAAATALLLAVLCLAGGLLPEAWLAALSLQPAAVAAGEVWRLWSGHFVHYGPVHAAVNAAAILILILLCKPVSRTAFALAALLVPPLLSLGVLALSPGLLEYRGGSGIASLLMLLALAAQARRAPRIVAALAGLWLLKLGLELSGLGSPWQLLPAGVEPSWPAHLVGLALGLALLAAQWTYAGLPDGEARSGRQNPRQYTFPYASPSPLTPLPEGEGNCSLLPQGEGPGMRVKRFQCPIQPRNAG